MKREIIEKNLSGYMEDMSVYMGDMCLNIKFGPVPLDGFWAS